MNIVLITGIHKETLYLNIALMELGVVVVLCAKIYQVRLDVNVLPVLRRLHNLALKLVVNVLRNKHTNAVQKFATTLYGYVMI